MENMKVFEDGENVGFETVNLSDSSDGAENGADGEKEAVESAETVEQSAEQPEEQKKVQTEEENRRFAAARREAQEKERKRYEAQLQREKDAFYAKEYSGMLNPYTNKPILTEADYLAYKTAYQKEEQDMKLQKAGLDAETIQGIVEQSPTVLAAKEVLEEARRQKEAAQKQQLDSFVKTQFEELVKRFPGAEKDLDAMSASPEGREVIDLWTKGVSLTQAYAAVNYDKLTAKTAAAAKQATMNSLSGKAHLTATAGAPGDDVSIPADVMMMYKSLMPRATDAEIRQHYKKNHS